MCYKLLIVTLFMCGVVRGANILGVFPSPASHYILGNALMKGLAEAGHNVTVISPFEDKKPPKRGSYRSIALPGFEENYEKMLEATTLFEVDDTSIITMNIDFFDSMAELNDKFFSHKNVQRFLKSEQKFDVVIVEQFINDAMKIFGYVYNAPVIAFSTLGSAPWINPMVANPWPISYIPEQDLDFSPNMSFKERLVNTYIHTSLRLLEHAYYFPQQNQILKRHFPDAPDIYDLYYNVSLALINSHESLTQPVPLVPNMIQIGGFHVKPPKKLPSDLQEFLDNSIEGVIYFSLGTHLKSSDLPPAKRDIFLKAFGKLKEQVLWKWEDADMPGKPSNVETAKWLPQQDILAHPNVKLFITHSGLLSTTEAVYQGVPVLGIPVFADQYINAKLSAKAGYGLSLAYSDPSFSEEKFSQMLEELLNNPKYRENAKKISQLFHDRPMKPMDAAVYWVEYVIRHKGAPHLRVAGVRMPWYIYHSVDVISFIALIVSLCICILVVTIRSILHYFCIFSSRKSKSKEE